MKTTLAMTASALAVLGYAETEISFAYDQDEVREMWDGLSDQAKEGAEAVLLGYILLANDDEMMPGTMMDDTMIPGEVDSTDEEETEGMNLAQTEAGWGCRGGWGRGFGGWGCGFGGYGIGGWGGYGGYGWGGRFGGWGRGFGGCGGWGGWGGWGRGCGGCGFRRGCCFAETGAEADTEV